MKAYYLKKAEENLPKLFTKTIQPSAERRVMQKGDSLVLDLGNHYVGYFSFAMESVDFYIDAPVKLQVKFCEREEELSLDYSSYRGRLSASWLQEEIIHVDRPGVYAMPRRYAARFVKLTVLASPKKLSLAAFTFDAVTSADEGKLKQATIDDPELAMIDKLAVNTLKNCMQRVFEDGPKRDRRLWTGDFYLESLANYKTFENLALVRRCLYLFAALDKNDKGFFAGFLFEDPVFASGNWYLMDYALLYAVTLCDYYKESGDEKTFFDLYPVAKTQVDAALACLDEDGIVTIPQGCDAFIDWCPNLRKTISLHGVLLFTLKTLGEVLAILRHKDAEYYEEKYDICKANALGQLFDGNKGIFLSKRDGEQYSVHSAVWMILGGVLSGNDARTVLCKALSSSDSVKPFTPFMHHFVVSALMAVGICEDAFAYIKRIWGGMAKRGGDTFPEVYHPDLPDFSPYGDNMVNSMCHAWSCTPSYFIRFFDAK